MKLNNLAVKMIEKYQKAKPPQYRGRCLHYPTCSTYSKECYQKFNFFKASFLSFKRILFCNPLNKKTYDPVPLTKEEKKENQELLKIAEPIKDILLFHYKKYPQMQTIDFLKLIYQNSFGPNHLKVDVDKMKEYLLEEMKKTNKEEEIIEDIGNGYVRIYFTSHTDLEKLFSSFIKSMKEPDELDYRLFYKKIEIFQLLIKKKQIKLERKASNKIIQDFLFNLAPVHHSTIYNDIYKPHYRIIKKEYYN